MKKHDIIWIAALIAVIIFLIFPSTHEFFVHNTKTHPYLMGFIKVMILATMGELLALRIASGEWKKPVGVMYRAIVWGFLGMGFVIAFELFASGVSGAISKGLLPKFEQGFTSTLVFAFFTSTFMNLIFAPTFMAFHRITDTYIDLGEGKLDRIFKVSLYDVIDKINWYSFIDFVVLKTIPFFWIPAHTVTFLLPGEYRVLMAAFLSIALGGILAFAKKQQKVR